MSDLKTATTPHLDQSDVVHAGPLAAAGIRHAFFTRRGGVSTGLYAGLNVGSGSDDSAANVQENRRRAMRYLGAEGDNPATPWQVHSADAVIIREAFSGERPKADAVVTDVAGLAIGVVTADCGPVLFADRKAGVIGAAHAGWRGAIGGVLESTIASMEQIGSRRENIVAILGPCITPANYEVDAAMAEHFAQTDPAYAQFFTPGAEAGKRQFDLPAFVLHRLATAGVQGHFVERCTYAEESQFYSFRRTTHRKEPDYGRQLSAIIL